MEDQPGIGIDTISLISYNGTTEDITGGLSQLLTNTPATESGIDAAAPCQAFFEADLPASSLLPLVM